MADFLSMYSIQHWLESCPQGYLAGTEYGHPPNESEPDLILSDPAIREQAIGATVQLKGMWVASKWSVWWTVRASPVAMQVPTPLVPARASAQSAPR